ncbi:tRNA lysidine(34) synthetase TilS [Candidatus Gracilibacteria bacterium CG17_big_fil_post_rev_8_21_14_2_50_48_13]|nr:MAG: tRNA lysidine(34) synthetase TilS [Candidatus Gracilibacteria bacterium CG17_big_fil_post_rev_8_21_14_2_50_48_13]
MPWSRVFSHGVLASLPKEAPLVVAASGGVDSQVLLDLLGKHQFLQVHAVYIDHGWRADTQNDRAVVKQLIEGYGFNFHTCFVPPGTKQTEIAARVARYTLLEQMRAQIGAEWVLTAHHADDLLESQLLHLERGSGLFGLVGMQEMDRQRHLLRPLLKATKEDILAYAMEYHLPWHEDTTNANRAYARNRLRQDLIPSFTEEISDIYAWSQHLASQSRQQIENNDHATEAALGDWKNNLSWARSSWLSLSKNLQQHAVVCLLRDAEESYTQARVAALCTQLETMKTGGRALLASEVWIERQYDRFYLCPQDAKGAPLPDTIALPHDAPPSLQVKKLSSSMRLRRYKKTPTGWHIWHTSLKKWRAAQKITAKESLSLDALVSEDGEVFAIVHPKWQYPKDLPLLARPLPRG